MKKLNAILVAVLAVVSTLAMVDGVRSFAGGTVITAPSSLVNNAVTNAKLRDSSGLSVIGRSANSTGDPADIIAANDGEVLRRSGTSIGFGSIGSISTSWFGMGSDGSPTFDGSTTILGIAPASVNGCNTYTLARDLSLDSPILNASTCIRENGFRLLVKTKLTCGASSSRILQNGNPGSGTSAGAGPNANSVGNGANGGAGQAGGAGIAGTANALAPSGYWALGTGGAAGTTAPTAGGTPSCQGCGGGGGGATGAGGGLGGGMTGNSAAAGGAPSDLDLSRGRTLAGVVYTFGAGGAGGGSTGGSTGGGGGGGGGETVVIAKQIDGACTFEAKGGAGAAGTGANGGGGGGGGGGHVEVIFCSHTGSAAALDASGGTHGNGAGTGTNGGDGAAGTTRAVNVCIDSTTIP